MKTGAFRLTLRGHLWRYHPQKLRSWETPWQEGCTVHDLLNNLGIPEGQIMLILVNGTRSNSAYCPQKGDHVEVLPVVDGG
jgi:sulfur carrier protein ThiS